MAPPFELVSTDAGVLRDGRVVRLQPMTPAAAAHCGPACAAIDPWRRYGITAEQLTATFAATSGSTFRYQALVGDEPAGVMIIVHPWLIGPYLQFIAVLPAYQSQGVGRTLLDWFENRARASGQRNVWLCVTGFNDRAAAIYRASGWQQAAVLPDLVTTGIDENLLRKRLF